MQVQVDFHLHCHWVVVSILVDFSLDLSLELDQLGRLLFAIDAIADQQSGRTCSKARSIMDVCSQLMWMVQRWCGAGAPPAGCGSAAKLGKPATVGYWVLLGFEAIPRVPLSATSILVTGDV